MTQLPSVIDEIKARYRIPTKPPLQQYPQSKNQLRQSQNHVDHHYVDQYSGSEVKFKRSRQKPEALLNIKTTPIIPPPDIKFTKMEVKQLSPNNGNYAETIFSNLSHQQQRMRSNKRSLSVQNDSRDESMSTIENYNSNQSNINRTTQQAGLRILTNLEAQSQYSSPQKTAQNQYNQQRICFDECNGDEETFRMKVPRPRSEEKIPKVQNEKISNLIE